MSRFVLLHHVVPPGTDRATHWDLMLQIDDVLKSWELHELPTPGKLMRVRSLPDHRLAYLDYEGPISDDRGQVKQWDTGQITWLDRNPAQLTAQLWGRRQTIEITLTPDDADGSGWDLRCQGLTGPAE